MNRIAGYRRMIGFTQKEMARELKISEGTYRNKEKGRANFVDREMEVFYDLVRKEVSNVSISDIFFTSKPTKKDARRKEVV